MRSCILLVAVAVAASTSAGHAQSAATTRPSAPANSATSMATSVPGGPGQVWVNTRSKVYHCQGDRDYGHTKAGQYMTEQAAKAAGDRPSRGKACS